MLYGIYCVVSNCTVDCSSLIKNLFVAVQWLHCSDNPYKPVFQYPSVTNYLGVLCCVRYPGLPYDMECFARGGVHHGGLKQKWMYPSPGLYAHEEWILRNKFSLMIGLVFAIFDMYWIKERSFSTVDNLNEIVTGSFGEPWRVKLVSRQSPSSSFMVEMTSHSSHHDQTTFRERTGNWQLSLLFWAP